MSTTNTPYLKSGTTDLVRRQVYIQTPIEASMERLGIDYETLCKVSWFHIHCGVQEADTGADGRTRGVPENAKGSPWQRCSDVCQPRQVLRALRRNCRSDQPPSSGIRVPTTSPKHDRSFCTIRGRRSHGVDTSPSIRGNRRGHQPGSNYRSSTPSLLPNAHSSRACSRLSSDSSVPISLPRGA